MFNNNAAAMLKLLNSTYQLVLVSIIVLFTKCGESDSRLNTTQSEYSEMIKGDPLEIKPILKMYKWRFLANNSNPRMIGFLHIQHEQSICIKNMVLENNYVYFADPVHSNVKRIDLLNGEILTSAALTNRKFTLGEITILNDTIHVFSDQDVIYSTSKTFQYYDSFLINDFRWDKTILFQNAIESIITRPVQDVFQKSDLNMRAKVLRLMGFNWFKSDSIELGSWENSNLQLHSIRGKYYEVGEIDSTPYISTPFGKYLLQNRIPNTSKYYDSENLDFNSNSLVYYDVNPLEIIIYFLVY
jgi:hypothetical protein